MSFPLSPLAGGCPQNENHLMSLGATPDLGKGVLGGLVRLGLFYFYGYLLVLFFGAYVKVTF